MIRIVYFILFCLSLSVFAQERDYRKLPSINPKATDVLAAAGIEVFAFRLPVADTNGCAISLRLKHGKKDEEIELCRRLTHDELAGQDGVDVIITIQETQTFFGGRKLKVGYMVGGCPGSVLVSARDLPFVFGGDVMLDPEDKILLAGSYRTGLPSVDGQRTALYLVASPWKDEGANNALQRTAGSASSSASRSAPIRPPSLSSRR
jgi:hypothetical protein